MPILEPAPSFNLKAAENELGQFRTWLKDNADATERVAVTQLKSLPALCPLLGMYDGRKYPTVQKWEFEIQGVFRADFVAGNPARKEFVLVEFEGAKEHSIFGPSGTNQMRNWGSQVQHGFSQIADWSWAKNESQHSGIFQSALGADDSTESYVLVCGRDSSLMGHERSRLLWRHSKTAIAGCRVLFQTYDDLAEHFESCLDFVRSMR
jgi:Domain of unknown function (DUF4263)